jgi:predicted ABC-type ATPase
MRTITKIYLQKLGGLVDPLQSIEENQCPPFLREKRGVISPKNSPGGVSGLKYNKTAVFITGAAGSGKSYIQRYVFSAVPDFKYYLYNPDIYLELLMEEYKLLQKEAQGEYVKASPKKQTVLVEAIKEVKARNKFIDDALMQHYIARWKDRIIRWFIGIAQACTQEDYNRLMAAGIPLVIDRPGDTLEPKYKSASSVMQQVRQLKKHGYDVYMIIVYANKETALERNAKRARSLPDAVIEKIWEGLFGDDSNVINAYQKELGDKMILLDNSGGGVKTVKGIHTVSLENAKKRFSEWMS